MDGARFLRLRSLYERAEEVPTDERDAFVVAEADGDADLAEDVRRMLRGRAAGDFLESPIDLDDACEPPPQPERIGPFRVLGVLGRGGFGVVYRAEQEEPVRREVALKVLHAHRLDARSRLRFETERRTLARMTHRGIAQLYDAGRTPEGQLYFAMEFVDGAPITAACDADRLPVDARLALFLEVCEAVQHAHQRGVVHRDLKPGNVLVRRDGDALTPKVIDFGIAKLLLGENADEPGEGLTREGLLLGTPGYMSPEQAAGRPVDTRTDVYTLGVLLYDLLTGELPFPRERLTTEHPAEVVRLVCEEEPRRLSTALAQGREPAGAVAARRGCEASALHRTLRGDLEWIVRKALAKEPDQRYDTVSELAADVRRFRDHEPVSAREPAARYLVRKFVARHRLGVALGAASLAVLVLGLVGLTWALRVVDEARGAAEAGRSEAERSAYAAHLVAARAALRIGDVRTAERQLASAAPERRGWEWRHLAGQCDVSSAGFETTPQVLDLFWLEGDAVALFHLEGFEVRRLADGAVERPLERLEPQFDDALLDRATGRFVVDLRDRVEVWDALGEGPRRLLHSAERDVRSMALSPDGRTVLTSENGGVVRALDLAGVRAPRVVARMPSYSWAIAFLGPSGERAAFGTAAGRVEVRDVRSGEVVRVLDCGVEDVKALAATPDGRTLFASAGPTLQRWDVESGRLLVRRPVELALTELRVSADGRRVFGAAGWLRSSLGAWSAETLEVDARLVGHRTGLKALDEEPGGGRLASADFDGVVKLWPTRPRRAHRRLEAGYDARDLSIAADGRAFATADTNGRVTIWPADDLDAPTRFETGVPLYGCALGEDTVWVVGDALQALDRESGGLLALAPCPARGGRLAVDPEERWLAATAAGGGRLALWRLPDLEPMHAIEAPFWTGLEYDAVTERFLVAGLDGVLRAVEPESGAVEALSRHDDTQWDVTGSAERLLLASAGALEFTDRTTGAQGSWPHSRDVCSVAIEPGDGRVATGGCDHLVTLWEPGGTELLVLDEATKPLIELGFASGGRLLVGLSHHPGSPTYVDVWEAPADSGAPAPAPGR